MMNLLFSAQGRINRGRYWLAFLLHMAIIAAMALAFYIISQAVPGVVTSSRAADGSSTFAFNATGPAALLMILVGVVGYVALIWSSICVAIKRFHDRNASGWKMFIALIPIIGGIWYIVEVGFLAGTPGPNRFGPDPLATGYANALAV